jgi:ribose transport system permease protein
VSATTTNRNAGRPATVAFDPLAFARLHWTDGPVVSAAVLVLLMLVYNLYAPAFTGYQFLILSTGSLALALAAVGETLVVLTGGFDLSTGAIIAFTNVVLATHLTGSTAGKAAAVAVALIIATAAGAVNGLLVAYPRLQSIIVTIATMFVFNGLALFVLDQPGGSVPASFPNTLNATFGGVPVALVGLIVVALAWVALRRTGFGKALQAVGGDRQAAVAAGIRPGRVVLGTYALAGLCYGLAGVVLTAQISSGDPGVGASFLLTAFTAVVIGGTRFGGGAGSAVGSVIGAVIITLIVGVLTVSGVNTFATNIVEGLVLMASVLLAALTGRLRVRRPVFNRAGRPGDAGAGPSNPAGATSARPSARRA